MSEPAPDFIASLQNLIASHAAVLQSALPGFLSQQRWFAGKTHAITNVTIADLIPLESAGSAPAGFWLLLADVELSDATQPRYAIPLGIRPSADSDESRTILRFAETGSEEGATLALIEASAEPAFWRGFLKCAVGQETRLRFVPTAGAPDWTPDTLNETSVELHDVEQSNTSVILGAEHFLKLFRRPSAEINPDVEIGVCLTNSDRFQNSPAVAGHVEYHPPDGPPECLALISELVPAIGDAWTFTLSRIDEFWQRLFRTQKLLEETPGEVSWSVDSCSEPLPDDAELIGGFLDEARLLGRRTAELHIALASESEVFRPEPASNESVREHLAMIRQEADATAALLESAETPDPVAADLPARIREAALARLDDFESSAGDISCRQIRVHGDYHLGQVLRTADDFVIIDFEGEPDRPIAERRARRSAMKDVAGLVRSLHYAACAGAADLTPALDDRRIPENVAAWQNFWFGCSARSFLRGYLETAAGQVFLPESSEQTQQLLDLFLLEKVLYELRYELNNRPDWVPIPLAGLQAVLHL